MKLEEVKKIQEKAYKLLKRARIVITPKEKENIEVAGFGLNDVMNFGIEVIVYENNDRYCAKELILFPRQTCPEHRHPPLTEKNPGKQETFRCRWGEAYLYTEGEATASPKAVIPESHKKFFSVWKEIILRPGDQHTLPPNTLHWFQAGNKGAIVSEFSSTSFDEKDVWTNPSIQRIPVID